MKKISVDMGAYYTSLDQTSLVRTVGRATDVRTLTPMIMFVNVKEGGCASEPFVMAEDEFVSAYMS